MGNLRKNLVLDLIIWPFHWFNGKLLLENQHFKEEIHQIGGFSIVILVFGGVPTYK